MGKIFFVLGALILGGGLSIPTQILPAEFFKRVFGCSDSDVPYQKGTTGARVYFDAEQLKDFVLSEGVQAKWLAEGRCREDYYSFTCVKCADAFAVGCCAQCKQTLCKDCMQPRTGRCYVCANDQPAMLKSIGKQLCKVTTIEMAEALFRRTPLQWRPYAKIAVLAKEGKSWRALWGLYKEQYAGLVSAENIEAYEPPTDCPVCLDKQANCRSNPCGHLMCERCIKGLKDRQQNGQAPPCPLCRTNVTAITAVAITPSWTGNQSMFDHWVLPPPAPPAPDVGGGKFSYVNGRPAPQLVQQPAPAVARPQSTNAWWRQIFEVTPERVVQILYLTTAAVLVGLWWYKKKDST